ncbi:MAG: ComF family protein [Anaerolineae bacterium]
MLTHSLLQKSTQSLLDLLFPPNCIVCKAPKQWLCESCYNQITFIVPPICLRCGTPGSSQGSVCEQCRHNPLQFIGGIRSASYFEDNPIRPAIHFLKYRNHKAVVTVLAKILAQAYQRYGLEADVIVPVPLHPVRLRERGYNQSELLAHSLSQELGLSLDTKSLQRTRQTKSQMTLGSNERHHNVAGAFACRGTDLRGQKVLLIDDVCTTGSTLDSCAEALMQNGVASVWGLTLAKAR